MDDNAKLVSIIQKKDTEIERLQKEASQHTQMLDLQTHTLNKLLTNVNNGGSHSPNRYTATERNVPTLSKQKSNEYSPFVPFSNTTVHQNTKTPSPSRTFVGVRNVTPETISIKTFKNLRKSHDYE